MVRVVLAYPQLTDDITTATPTFAFIADDETQTLRMVTGSLTVDQILNDPSVLERVPPNMDTSDVDAMLRYGVSNMTVPLAPPTDHQSLEEAAQHAHTALRRSE